MFLLQIGNGLQSSMMGVRGSIEGFSTFQISLIASMLFPRVSGRIAVFAPVFIAKVGHVRFFAALGSLISATLISYPLLADPLRLDDLAGGPGGSASRGLCLGGKLAQRRVHQQPRGGRRCRPMCWCRWWGWLAAQGILSAGDPTGWLLFVIPSILVSISFAPILLSVQPAPAFGASRAMSLGALYRASPFGVVGMALLGSVFAGQLRHDGRLRDRDGAEPAATFGLRLDHLRRRIILQYPIGWLSDRMGPAHADRGPARLWRASCRWWAISWATPTPSLLAVGVLSGGLAQPLLRAAIA